MSDSEQKPGFVIKDRRSFTPGGGEPREEPEADEEAGEPGEESGDRRLPPVDFGTFVLSLGSSALMHLGEVEHPQSGHTEKDLPMAKHSIDILSMLQQRTKGNLTAQEDQLLESLLYDLRIRYVSASKTP